ncbi:DNA mismatch repair endonuclease MutL [Candidatus Woesearchaeota archaeon]|nr:DNA mismatch repair endonuclease MutL [Candidatus Woesearchaeota archaeon]
MILDEKSDEKSDEVSITHGIIKQLDADTINKIAAGEVIERPASVIKELIENSLDAGADDISIKIRNGGRDYIQVADNGTGMSKEDLKLSVLRHATSKIRSHEDLFGITTLGFRGEAMSSIAAVSELTIRSMQGEQTGYNFDVSSGKIEAASGNKGTIITVDRLFDNVPARKKFLGTKAYEQKLVIGVVQKYALIHPEISIKLVNEDGVLVQKPKTASIIDNIGYIYGQDVAKEGIVLESDKEQDAVSVDGAIVKPTINRHSKDYIAVYINKRHIKSKIVEDSIMDALKTLVFRDRYPIVVINLDIDPSRIDVNVHPSKKIVKFDRNDEIYAAVYDSISYTVKKHLFGSASSEGVETKQMSFRDGEISIEKPKETNHKYEKPDYFSRASMQTTISNDSSSGQMHKDQTSYGLTSTNTKSESDDTRPLRRILGAIHKTYIIIEDKGGLMIVDQHAADERIRYEKLMLDMVSKKIALQNLLNPISIEFNSSEYAEVSENLQKLTDLGFEIEEFGELTLQIRSIPRAIDVIDLKTTLLEVASRLKVKDEEALIYLACRKAIKAGDELSPVQMKDLIDRLNECEKPMTCPHGRPTTIKLSINELEKDFKRIG